MTSGIKSETQKDQGDATPATGAPETKIGATLVKEGMITDQGLAKGLKQQDELRNMRIGGILAKQGLVSHSEISGALKVQKTRTDQRLGDLLIASGAISPDNLAAALKEQQKHGAKRLGEILVEMKLINGEMLALAIALQNKVPYVDLHTYRMDPLAINCITPETVKRLNVVPIKLDKRSLTVASADPIDLNVKTDLSFATSLDIKEAIASQEALKWAIKEYYGVGIDINEILSDGQKIDVAKPPDIADYDLSEKVGKEKPIVAIVNHILNTAVVKRASDIHVLAERKKIEVKFRVDGQLRNEMNLPVSYLPSIIARMKILGNMNIAERRLPQDGRARVRIAERTVDLRFSCLPSVLGESMVIRVLDKEIGVMNLADLGFFPEEIADLRRCLGNPFGMILFTGPTGSGKSTTIYACLQEPVLDGKNIITLENPVEYELPGVCQVQMNAEIGLTFSRGLRQVLRHDPDVVAVGEIRDKETARISVEAALTGHLFISTLHTNTAAEVFIRLADMGIEPYLVSTSILGAVSQRLIRKICTHCKELDPKGNEKLKFSHFPMELFEGVSFYQGKGCEACNGTGYKGRTIVYEFLEINEEIKRAAMERQPAHQIRQIAIRTGMRPLKEIAFQKLKEGGVSVDDIIQLLSGQDMNETSTSP